MNSTFGSLKRNSFTLFIAVMFVTMTTNVALAQSALANEAFTLLNKEQPKKAIEQLKAANTTPTTTTWFQLGYGLLRTGDLAGAKDAFDKSIALDEKFALGYAGRGRVALKQNNVTEAKVQFDNALKLTKSKNVDVLNVIGEGYLENPQFVVTGMELLNKADNLSSNAITSNLLGDGYLLQNNGGKSVSSYESAAAQNQKDAYPHYKIGTVYTRSTNYDVALTSFEKAISIDPNFGPAYREAADIYYQKKRGEDAVAAQQKYISLTERTEVGVVRLAFYQFMAKDYAGANTTFQQAYAREKGLNETGLRYYALSLHKAENDSTSVKIFDEYFAKAKPEAIEYTDLTAYGEALSGTKQDSLAIIAFDKSLALEPKQPQVLQARADALVGAKKYDEAIVALKSVIAQRKDAKATSKDLWDLGRAYYFSEKYMEADTTFRKLIEAQPTMLQAYLWAGRANASLDPESDKGTASPLYTKVIELALQDPAKNKNILIEGYSYFGYHYFVVKDIPQSKQNWEKVLGVDPANEKAKEALKAIKTLTAPAKPK